MKTIVFAPPLLLAATLLAGCLSRIDAPSLLPRPVEASRPDDLPVRPAPADADPALVALASRLTAQAAAADAAFDRALPMGMRAGAQGSEAWIAAQSARSAAEIARTPALDALTELDTAIAAATDRGADPAPLMQARGLVQAMIDRQAARVAALEN